jgi:hypothetical protein
MIYHQKQGFRGALLRKYARFFRLCNQAPPNKRVQVQFGVQPLPEPEPDCVEPEPRVQFRVQANPLN